MRTVLIRLIDVQVVIVANPERRKANVHTMVVGIGVEDSSLSYHFEIQDDMVAPFVQLATERQEIQLVLDDGVGIDHWAPGS